MVGIGMEADPGADAGTEPTPVAGTGTGADSNLRLGPDERIKLPNMLRCDGAFTVGQVSITAQWTYIELFTLNDHTPFGRLLVRS